MDRSYNSKLLLQSPKLNTFEAGLSYFHKSIFTVLKQQKSKLIIHRKCKYLRNDYFGSEFENISLKYDFNNIDYDNFIIKTL